MSGTLWSIVLSFVLVTIVGSIFATSLQFRNWIRQQQVSHHEVRIAELTTIFLDLDTSLTKRLYWTRRLLYAIRRYNEARLPNVLAKYDEAITEWNQKRNSFQIRLAGAVSVASWQEFEHFLAPTFVEIGSELEGFTRLLEHSKGATVDGRRLYEIEDELNSLSHSIYDFTRRIYRAIKKEETAFYAIARAKRLPDNLDELSFVSTWFLFKTLFIPPRMMGEEF
jgi:hypothetical protein